jgi:hypothetical protein
MYSSNKCSWKNRISTCQTNENRPYPKHNTENRVVQEAEPSLRKPESLEFNPSNCKRQNKTKLTRYT